jgi:ATPase subunit of ABC transporter with duplicated ATPase domains
LTNPDFKKISYKINDLELIKEFSMLILKGEKIGIIGGNGTGKSTFIKLLPDELQSDSGMIRRSKTIKLAYFDQMRENLDPNMKVINVDLPVPLPPIIPIFSPFKISIENSLISSKSLIL